MSMNFAARLRHRVDLQQRCEVQDKTTGAIVIEWRTLHSGIPAEVLTGAGREAVRSGAEMASTDARITLRWFPCEQPTALRLRYGCDWYNVTAATTDATGRRWWRFEATKGVTDGR